MKITAYMNLQPSHISFDTTARTASLTDVARALDIYPDMVLAKAALEGGAASYEVVAELPDGSVFEVRGQRDQTEGRGGTYVAGLFDNYPAAYAASDGLGVMGSHGYIGIRLAPATILQQPSGVEGNFSAGRGPPG